MVSEGLVLDSAGVPVNGRSSSKTFQPIVSWSAQELIRHAKEHPPEPIIQGLINKGDILLLHGSEESFKSVFILQIAESIATATPLLMTWNVPRAWKVGIIETEIHEVMLGERLLKMFPDGNSSSNLQFMGESALRGWRRLALREKFVSIQKWIEEKQIDVLMIDTANDFFRGTDNPSDERAVGGFFDELRSLRVGARAIVRHDRKQQAEMYDQANTNERIRGSSEWKEDPETILSLARVDRRTNEVGFEVGKLRYGRKPQPLKLWFDARTFRLTPLPPVIQVLYEADSSRGKLIAACEERFGLATKTVDNMLAEQKPYLTDKQAGHEKIFGIDIDHAQEASWFEFLMA
jgi:hypothetical protein